MHPSPFRDRIALLAAVLLAGGIRAAPAPAPPESGGGEAGPPSPSANGPDPDLLPRFGRHLARGGRALAGTWKADASPDAAGLACDGDPVTSWTAGEPGPATWQVRLARPDRISLVAVLWKERAPRETLVEVSSDGLLWTEAARLEPPEPGDGGKPDLIVVRSPTAEVEHLRLTVPRTAAGEVVGLREVAAYAEGGEIPAALLAGLPGEKAVAPWHPVALPRLSSSMALAAGWSVAWHGKLPESGELGQIVPTASGGAFVSVFPAGRDGVVFRIEPGSGDAGEPIRYLGGLEPGTGIAWDGEWLYTLSGGKLDRVRKALGPGPADERWPAGRIFPLPEAGAAGPHLADFRLGGDGGLYALIHGGRVPLTTGDEGVPIGGTGSAVYRFRRDGGGGRAVAAAAPSALRFEFGESGLIRFFEDRGHLEGVARLEELLAVERDGERIWAVAGGREGLGCVCLVPSGGPGPVRVSWDDLAAPALFGFLEAADRPSVRREGGLEVLRRRRDPSGDLLKVLSGNPPEKLAETLVAVVEGLPEAVSRPWLRRLAEAAPPETQAAALLAVANGEGARDHPVFAELGRSTVPRVTAALFQALLRSGSQLRGAEGIALELAAHPDPVLAESARSFLDMREPVEMVFSTLDDPDKRELWPRAFAFLEGQPRVEVVAGLVKRLERTSDPVFRREALRVLCALHWRMDERGRHPWLETGRIGETLRAALEDSRVDRPALLAAMDRNGIALPDARRLVRLAASDPSLEPFVLEAIRSGSRNDDPVVRGWLEKLADDPSRDDALRESARELLEPGSAKTPPQAVEASLAAGRRLFARVGCLDCHRGGGTSSFAPDLASVLAGRSDPELEAILRGSVIGGGGLVLTEIEDREGRRFAGVVESREEGMLRLRDRAGNEFGIPLENIVRESGGAGRFAGCDGAADLDEAGFRVLLSFLRQLHEE